MFKRKRKPGQPIGTDLDWFVIPIRTIRLWGILLLVFIVVGLLAFAIRSQTRHSPQDRALTEISSASDLVKRASAAAAGSSRPGSHVVQARDFLQGAQDAY